MMCMLCTTLITDVFIINLALILYINQIKLRRVQCMVRQLQLYKHLSSLALI